MSHVSDTKTKISLLVGDKKKTRHGAELLPLPSWGGALGCVDFGSDCCDKPFFNLHSVQNTTPLALFLNYLHAVEICDVFSCRLFSKWGACLTHTGIGSNLKVILNLFTVKNDCNDRGIITQPLKTLSW